MKNGKKNELKMIAWETTRVCNLSCVHCRASARKEDYPDELSTEECLSLIDNVASFSSPVIILTGGEPLMRDDIFELAKHGTDKGLRMVMATNGTLMTEDIARKMLESGIKRVSISLDGSTKAIHDKFRRVEGAFEKSLKGIEYAKNVGLDFQINTTITGDNLSELEPIFNLAIKLKAAAFHLFLLVPTGRGKEIYNDQVVSQKYEEMLNWFYEQEEKAPLEMKATCAPLYYRILKQRGRVQKKNVAVPGHHGLHSITRGCLGGYSFCFVSHVGQVQPCGYLELDCGNVRRQSLQEIWNNSSIFHNLRDFSKYEGKCGICEYIKVCGGCRARAYELTGNYLGEDPICSYLPAKMRKGC